MQNEKLIKNESKGTVKIPKLPNIDLDTKKEIAKIGMTASMGITVATSFYMKNKLMKNLHIGAGVALVGFSFWHHMLYQPDKNKQKPKLQAKDQDDIKKQDISNIEVQNENYSISLNNFFIELSIKGKLTHNEFKEFEKRIESLLELYKIPSMNILLDITEIKAIEIKALWDDLMFSIKHLKEIKKVAIVGNNKLEEYSISLVDKLLDTKLSYFKDYEKAHKWLLS